MRRLLACLCLPAAALAVQVESVRCYVEDDHTFVVFYLDGEARIEVATDLAPGEVSLALVARGTELTSSGHLGAPVGLVRAGEFHPADGDAVFLVFPTAAAGGYKAYLARDPWRAVLELTPAAGGATALPTAAPVEDGGRPLAWEAGTILVVDDDDGVNNGNPYGLDVNQRYLAALESLGVPYETAVVSHNSDGPSYAKLSGYPLVLWFTGLDAFKVCLSGGDRANLRRYLDGGGRLLLVSQNYLGRVTAQGSASAGSLEEALGIARWQADARSLVALAEPEDELNAGMPLVLCGERQIIGNWSDGFTPSARGRGIYRNRERDDCSGVVAEDGTYRSAFLCFPWENIESELEARGLMARLLNWLVR